MNKIFLNGIVTQKHMLSDGKRLAVTLMPLNDKTITLEDVQEFNK